MIAGKLTATERCMIAFVLAASLVTVVVPLALYLRGSSPGTAADRRMLPRPLPGAPAGGMSQAGVGAERLAIEGDDDGR